MSFKVYKNKITGHTSVSVRQKEKKRWFNLPMSHSKPKDSYIVTNAFIKDGKRKNRSKNNSYIRKYVRNDKRGVRGHPYNEISFDDKCENEIKQFLKNKYKKR